MKKYKVGDAGFTLLEIMITISMAAILVVPLSGLFIRAFKVHRDALEKQNMSLAAQSVIERYIYSVEDCDEQIGECNGYSYEIIRFNEMQLNTFERELSPYGFAKIKVIVKNRKHPNREIVWALYRMNKSFIN